MIYPQLAPIDWKALLGGDEDTSAAITARNRKLAATAKLTRELVPLARRLESIGGTYTCSAEILEQEPLAGRWYLDLAALTRKLISKLRPSYSSAGLQISPETIAANREQGRSVKSVHLPIFADWINKLLIELYPPAARSGDLALCTVLAVAGARIQGQVQNKAGDDAVLILKKLMVGAFSKRRRDIEVGSSARNFSPYSSDTDHLEHRWLRFGGRVVCEFVPGGNRPDIRASVDGIVIAQGEVKGRTDLSNVWESWMPQINGHLQTWAAENSQAPRIFFGTIITQEMIDGVTQGGTKHTGLKAFANNGLLKAAYNLTNIVEGLEGAEKAFDDLVDQLCLNL